MSDYKDKLHYSERDDRYYTMSDYEKKYRQTKKYKEYRKKYRKKLKEKRLKEQIRYSLELKGNEEISNVINDNWILIK